MSGRHSLRCLSYPPPLPPHLLLLSSFCLEIGACSIVLCRISQVGLKLRILLNLPSVNTNWIRDAPGLDGEEEIRGGSHAQRQARWHEACGWRTATSPLELVTSWQPQVAFRYWFRKSVGLEPLGTPRTEHLSGCSYDRIGLAERNLLVLKSVKHSELWRTLSKNVIVVKEMNQTQDS